MLTSATTSEAISFLNNFLLRKYMTISSSVGLKRNPGTRVFLAMKTNEMLNNYYFIKTNNNLV
ncbi:hypothetical protein Hanom_Chr02g00140681 [Helianthus anomalus]